MVNPRVHATYRVICSLNLLGELPEHYLTLLYHLQGKLNFWCAAFSGHPRGWAVEG